MTSINTTHLTETQTDTPCPCIKEHLRDVWDDGDYATFATYMEGGAIEVLNQWPIPAGASVLDVACGSGQTALPAARLGADVFGIDIAESQILAAKKRASREGLNARFEVGDAEDLPCDDQSQDVIITMFGAMFAPDPKQVVAEFHRVLKPGGRLIMANWTADSMPARMFKCVSQYNPPHPDVIPPVLWGDEDTVVERLSDAFTDFQLTRRIYPKWHYPFSADRVVDLFREQFGPVKQAFEKIEEDQCEHLHRQLTRVFLENSTIRNGTLKITEGEYLEVIATKR